MGLAQTHYTNPDYVVVKCWTNTSCLFPDIANQTGPLAYHYVQFFQQLANMPLGTSCKFIMAILDHSDTMKPFIVTIYPA